MEITKSYIDQLEKITCPQKLLGEIFKTFENRAIIGTSGQLTGVAMIDMACKEGVKPRVFTLDTLRLFQETYDLLNALETKYQINIERLKPDPVKLDNMLKEHGEYLFFDSKEKQKLCCHIRKVEPNERVLDSVDIWITGLRIDQSKARGEQSRFEIMTHGEDKRKILKISPLLNWSEKMVRDYIDENKVPIHSLLEWNQDGWYYESLGCQICTTPIGPYEPRRAGRWRWFNADNPDSDKECGIHTVRKVED
jgi:phosphoadenosine phosphosulfate reductase